MTDVFVPVPNGSLQIPVAEALSAELFGEPLKFSVILPTYNEANNIQDIIQILSKLLDQKIPGNYELIVVDDDSPDQTWKTAAELLPSYPQLRVMRRQSERGLSTAVIRGWQVAAGEILGVIDADLQHPPEILLQLLEQMERGADLAIASRHVEGGGVSQWSLIRRFLSRGAQILGLILLPEVIGRLSDPMSGYFMVRREAIAEKVLSPVGYKILIEVTARGKINWIAEVGYLFRERQAGESKVTWRQYLEYLQHLIRLRFSLSARFLQFCFVGLTGVFVDMAVLFLLHDPSTLGLPLTRSKIISGEVAIINNFLWNDLWTFRDISARQPSKKQALKRFAKFNLICLAGLVLNVLILNLLYNFLGFKHLSYGSYLANMIAIVAVTIWNYWLNLKLSWRITETRQ